MRLAPVTGNPYSHRARSCALVALAFATLALPTGCVRRRLAVRSNPPGAVVFVDNQQIGTTPCSVDFTYYGTREIRLVKPGYETLTVNQPIPTPWYQIPPIDFVSENLLPNKIEDHRTVAFNLEPQIIVPTEQLLERANQLRQETLAGAAVLPPQTVVVPGPGIPPGVVAPGGAAPALVAPPDTFAPVPTLAPAPTVQPVPLPPTNLPPTTQPFTQPPYTQAAPPSTFTPNAVPPGSLPPTTVPSTIGPPTTAPPLTVPATTIPPSTGGPTTAPFSAPTLPPVPPAGSQQGRPIVSPPLR
jgi:hypothetical protein